MPIPIPSTLDADQCIKSSFDDATGRLRVDAQISTSIISPPGLEVSISDVDDSIKIGNGSGTYAQVTGANALKVDGSAVVQPVQTVQLFTRSYDAITVTYPSVTQEVYTSRIGGISGTVQQTATVNYTDSTKVNLLNVAVV